MDPNFDFIAPKPAGGLLLGCSSLTSRCWSGSVWLHARPSTRPDPALALGSYTLDGGCSAGVWVDGSVAAVAVDGGSVCWLRHRDGSLTCDAVSDDHSGTVTAMECSRDGGRLVTAGADCNITVYDTATHRPNYRYRPAHGQACTALAPAAAPAVFASAGLDGAVLMWDTRMDRPAMGVHRNADDPTTSLLWTQQHQLLLGSGGGRVYVCDVRVRRGNLPGVSVVRGRVRRLRGRAGQVAVCGDEPAVSVLTVTSGVPSVRWTETKHTDMVTDVCWLDDTTLLSCSRDSTLQTYTPAV